MCVRVYVRVWLTVKEILCLWVVCVGALCSSIPLFPGGKNAAITPLANEGGGQGCREKAEGGRGMWRRKGGWSTADLANNSK